MSDRPSWRDLNQTMWNIKTPLHLVSSSYDVAGFKAGRTSLRRHEIADLGDVTAKGLIHPLCHFGRALRCRPPNPVFTRT
jgi:hypothetical protein